MSEITPALTLTSGVFPGPYDRYILNGSSLAAAVDGTLWAGTSDGLCMYSSSHGDFTVMSRTPLYLPGNPGNFVAPVDARHCYFMSQERNGPIAISYYAQNAPVATLTPLPNDVPASIMAGSDGTLWCSGTSGNTYAYANASWSVVPSPGSGLVQMSVGSATFALALMNNGAIMSWNGTSWTQLTINPNVSWLAACADGSYWIRTPPSVTLTFRDGTSRDFPFDDPTHPFGFFTAASPYACYWANIVGGDAGFALVCATFGVVDQPAQSWPAMTPGQQAAYVALSNNLTIEDPAGIRGQYSNLSAPISIWYTEVRLMPCPVGVAQADWNVVQQQIALELSYVMPVQKFFTNVRILNLEVGGIITDTYNKVVKMVELPDQPADQPQSPIQVFLGGLIDKLIFKAVGQVPGPVKQAIGVGMGIYQFASALTAKNHGSPDGKSAIIIACSRLAGTIIEMKEKMIKSTDDFEASILSDWGRLQACGASIDSGIWYWPPDFDFQVLQGIGTAIELDFYKTLMAVKWEILQMFTVSLNMMAPGVPANVPAYSLLFKTVVFPNGSYMFWWWICGKIGMGADLSCSGPFPNKFLLETIFTLNDSNQEEFFTAANGWNLPIVVANNYQPPPDGVHFQPWQNRMGPAI